jgi:hypothetical protein
LCRFFWTRCWRGIDSVHVLWANSRALAWETRRKTSSAPADSVYPTILLTWTSNFRWRFSSHSLFLL